MNEPYRTPGRDIDGTQVEIAKIHEAAETKRKSIEEREKTKRTDIDNRDTFGYILPRMIVGVVAVAICIAGYYGWDIYVMSKSGSACHDESFSLGTNSFVCHHPNQVMVITEKEHSCRCGQPKLSAETPK